MKHSFTPATGTIILFVALSIASPSQSQVEGASVHLNQVASTSTVHKSTALKSGNDNSSSLLESNLKLKARFTVLFPGASQQQWNLLNKDYFVTFSNQGRNTRASFTPDGTMNYAISDCTMEQLPEAFQNGINKSYSGYTLKQGLEITAHNHSAYQAVLENAEAYITLKFAGETIEEIQTIKKSAR